MQVILIVSDYIPKGIHTKQCIEIDITSTCTLGLPVIGDIIKVSHEHIHEDNNLTVGLRVFDDVRKEIRVYVSDK